MSSVRLMTVRFCSETLSLQNFEFVLIPAASLDKSSMTFTPWCPKALDPAAGFHVHFFGTRMRHN